MSEVTLSVGGRDYTVSCAQGEEAHVAKLGAVIDAKIRQLGESARSPEAQNLLFAGLLMADELHEAKTKTADLEQDAGRFETEKAELLRAVDAANGKRDEMAGRVADLESELDNLQSAQQAIAQEREGDQTRLAEAIERSENLQRDLAASGSALTEAQSELTQARDAVANTPAFAVDPATPSQGNLAPALEGFADLLEQCAAKLEARG